MTNWPLFRAAAYLTGRGVTFGAPLIPPAAVNQNVYSICFAVAKGQGVAAFDQGLGVIAEGSLEHAYVGPMVEALDDPPKLIKQAVEKLRVGGHLVVLVRLGHEQPGVATFTQEQIEGWLASAHSWQLKDRHVQDGHLLWVGKKLKERRGGIKALKPRSPKRACIARYGALGDAIVMTPLVRALAEDGYEVTINISSYCAPVFENNPYVSNVIIQEKDLIPNQQLGEYWNHWEKEYDKYINLSESIEGDLLQIEGRPHFYTSKAWRHEKAQANYYDYTLKRGGYGHVTGRNGELYFTEREEKAATAYFQQFRGYFTFLWALNGSSHHKCYPMLEPALLEWFRVHPDSRCLTLGDYTAKLLEFEHPCLVPRAGEWSVRESLIACQYADLVIGPETMLTNTAGCFSTPKIVLLSHSTKENLTKYFKNDYSLEPDQRRAACYPCHQLHYTRESCPAGEIRDVTTGEVVGQAPICALSISPQRLLTRMDEVYAQWKRQ